MVALLGLLMLGGCGQVITRATPPPRPTPTLAVTPEATLRPTATPAPYTPAPTATPTITPTPVIYRVQSGDSLMAIAGRFGVSLQALQDANGILNTTMLHPNDELIIPLEEETTEQGLPTVTATPLPFVVEHVAFNHTPLGGLWCFGEILNSTGTDLEQAGVIITLRDEEGNALAEVETFVALELIAPGERAPFAVRFPEPPVTFASYTALPVAGVRGFVGSYYRDLVVRNTGGEGERYAAYTVTGTVANVGPEDAVDVVVVVSLYDSLGRVIGMRRVPPDHNVIPRGGETTFSVQLTPAGGPVAHFRVQALGRRVPGTPAAQPGSD